MGFVILKELKSEFLIRNKRSMVNYWNIWNIRLFGTLLLFGTGLIFGSLEYLLIVLTPKVYSLELRILLQGTK